jgi:hypothetical protein
MARGKNYLRQHLCILEKDGPLYIQPEEEIIKNILRCARPVWKIWRFVLGHSYNTHRPKSLRSLFFPYNVFGTRVTRLGEFSPFWAIFLSKGPFAHDASGSHFFASVYAENKLRNEVCKIWVGLRFGRFMTYKDIWSPCSGPSVLQNYGVRCYPKKRPASRNDFLSQKNSINCFPTNETFSPSTHYYVFLNKKRKNVPLRHKWPMTAEPA